MRPLSMADHISASGRTVLTETPGLGTESDPAPLHGGGVLEA
jgi:hypothetical protein